MTISHQPSNNNDLQQSNEAARADLRARQPEIDPSDPCAGAIADALAKLPEAQRQAVAEHLRRLVELSPAKRAAILTLTRE